MANLMVRTKNDWIGPVPDVSGYPPGSLAPPPQVDVRRIWRAFINRRWLILFITAAVLISVAVYSFLIAPTYMSTVVVQVDPEAVKGAAVQFRFGLPGQGPGRFRALHENAGRSAQEPHPDRTGSPERPREKPWRGHTHPQRRVRSRNRDRPRAGQPADEDLLRVLRSRLLGPGGEYHRGRIREAALRKEGGDNPQGD